MVVYGDLLFLINFSMDFLCFYLLCLLLHRALPTLRACIASAIGGVYSVLALFIVAPRLWALFCDIGVLVLMCLIVFLPMRMKAGKIVGAIMMYLFVSALLGGMMSALFSLFNRSGIFEGVKNEEGIGAWIFLGLALISFVFAKNGGRLFKRSASSKVVLLEVSDGRETVKLRALVDSGNLAVEPISGRGVVFASLDACEPIIDRELYLGLKHGAGIDELALSSAKRVRIIPTKTLGGERYLPSLRFTKVTLTDKNETAELDVYIALTNGESLGGYEAIISHEAII